MIDNRELRDHLLHAIDLAAAREWDAAKSVVEPMDNAIADRLFLLVSSLEEREAARMRQLATVRHEIGNSLSIARANLEGIVDGLLTASPQRLVGLIRALETASDMLDSLRHVPTEDDHAVINVQAFDARELVAIRINALQSMAAAKNVTLTYLNSCDTSGLRTFRGDPALIGHVIDEALSSAIRLTAPGGGIGVECTLLDHQLELRIKNHHPRAELAAIKRLVASIGGEAFIETKDGEKQTVLVIDFPVQDGSLQP